MNDDSNKVIKVKMRSVIFSDLANDVQKVSTARLVGVGRMKLVEQKDKKVVGTDKKVQLNKLGKNTQDNEYTKEDLEREGNESIF